MKSFLKFLSQPKNLILIFTPIVATIVALLISIRRDIDLPLSYLLAIVVFQILVYLCFGILLYRNVSIDKSIEGNLYRSSLYKLAEYRNKLDTYYEDEQYFKLLLANIRLETEIDKAKKIQLMEAEFWEMEALDKWGYFINVFKSLLHNLNKGDEYLTLSTIDIWTIEKKNKNPNEISFSTKLLSTNYNKCENSKIISKRVILVNKTKLVSGQEEEKKTEPHIVSPNELYFIKFKEVLKQFGTLKFNSNFINKFHFLEESDYEECIKKGIPFALIRKAKNDPKNINELRYDMCVSTYIPGNHYDLKKLKKLEIKNTQTDSIKDDSIDQFLKWRNGITPKIGLHIKNLHGNDKYWGSMYDIFIDFFESDNSKPAVDLYKNKELLKTLLKKRTH